MWVNIRKSVPKNDNKFHLLQQRVNSDAWNLMREIEIMRISMHSSRDYDFHQNIMFFLAELCGSGARVSGWCTHSSHNLILIYLFWLLDKIIRFSPNKWFDLICTPHQNDWIGISANEPYGLLCLLKWTANIDILFKWWIFNAITLRRSQGFHIRKSVSPMRCLVVWMDISTQIENDFNSNLPLPLPFARKPNFLMRDNYYPLVVMYSLFVSMPTHDTHMEILQIVEQSCESQHLLFNHCHIVYGHSAHNQATVCSIVGTTRGNSTIRHRNRFPDSRQEFRIFIIWFKFHFHTMKWTMQLINHKFWIDALFWTPIVATQNSFVRFSEKYNFAALTNS